MVDWNVEQESFPSVRISFIDMKTVAGSVIATGAHVFLLLGVVPVDFFY